MLRVPVVVTVTGEGGSGGALALGVGDRVYILEYGTYSVISPEGCAAILWKDQDRKADAAEAMRMTAPDLKALGIVDEIIPEPPAVRTDHAAACRRVGDRHRAALRRSGAAAPRRLSPATTKSGPWGLRRRVTAGVRRGGIPAPVPEPRPASSGSGAAWLATLLARRGVEDPAGARAVS